MIHDKKTMFRVKNVFNCSFCVKSSIEKNAIL